MKTPSKKEVKAYFKNAKEVRCLFDKEIYDISKWTRFFDNEDGSFWVEKAEKTSDQAELFDNGKYAEIISYKEKTHQISETLLKKLAENNSFSEELIKKEFPKLFLPTDIITIVEKYGKDKVISLIEKYEPKN